MPSPFVEVSMSTRRQRHLRSTPNQNEWDSWRGHHYNQQLTLLMIPPRRRKRFDDDEEKYPNRRNKNRKKIRFVCPRIHPPPYLSRNQKLPIHKALLPPTIFPIWKWMKNYGKLK